MGSLCSAAAAVVAVVVVAAALGVLLKFSLTQRTAMRDQRTRVNQMNVTQTTGFYLWRRLDTLYKMNFDNINGTKYCSLNKSIFLNSFNDIIQKVSTS